MIRFYRRFRKKKADKNFLRCVTADPKELVLLPGVMCKSNMPKENIVIGKHCTFGGQIHALHGGRISIGDHTYVGPGTMIQTKEQITIGNNVIIANNVILLDNNNHPVDPEARLQLSLCEDYLNDELWSWKYAESKPIAIEDNVWIGRDSRILKGVTIGKGSIVALGSIVTKDVPPYTVVAGNPAKIVKHLTPPQGENK